MIDKYLFVIDDMGSGGAQRQMSTLARLLADRGCIIDIFHYFPDIFYQDTLGHDNITMIYHAKTSKLGLGVIRKLSHVISEGDYKVALSFLATPNMYTVIANKWAKKSTKVVLSERTKTNFEGLRYRLKKWVNSKADYLVCNSMHESQNWLKHIGSLRGKSSCIYNSVDHDRFGIYIRTKKEVLDILVVGSISPAKNGLVLIEAIHQLPNKDIRVTWIGQKEYHIPERKEYIEKMENAISTYQLENQWTWVEPVQNIESYYGHADVLVHPSIIEGLPNVVCEGLSTGLPIIISNVLDHPILADEGRNGLLFDVENVSTLVDSIEQYYQMNQSGRDALSKNAHTFAVKKFSNQKFIKDYLNIFDSL